MSFAFLPVIGCTQSPTIPEPPIPQGVSKDAIPKIVVRKEVISIDGRAISVSTSAPKDWLLVIGQARKDGEYMWDNLGMRIGSEAKDSYTGLPKVYEFYIFVKRSKNWESFAYRPGSSFRHDRPENTFPGYLEIDGVPIGSNMTLTEIQQWRKFLGLPELVLEPGTRTYYVYEKGVYTHEFTFEDDDKLTYVKFM